MTDLLTRTVPPPPPPVRQVRSAEPASAMAGTVAERLGVAVAPTTGRFRPAPTSGVELRAGQLLGHVTGGRGRADEVRCPVDATLEALLVRPGQLVTRGQGLAWLALAGPATPVTDTEARR